MRNYPRAEIVQLTNEAIRKAGGPTKARVYFKFTCAACGERCTFTDPNTLWEHGECCHCGHTTPITEAGFLFEAAADGFQETTDAHTSTPHRPD